MTGVGVSGVLADQAGTLSVGVVFDFVRAWTEDGLQTTTLGIGPVIEPDESTSFAWAAASASAPST